MAPGSLERYPAGLFTGSDGSQIRRFLQVKKGDILLHNWHDGCLYVFRNTTNRVETLENEKMVLNARIAELEETLRNKNFEQK